MVQNIQAIKELSVTNLNIAKGIEMDEIIVRNECVKLEVAMVKMCKGCTRVFSPWPNGPKQIM